MVAGDGGKGGNGFLKVTNINQPGSSSEGEFVWTTPGTYNVDPNTIFPEDVAGDVVQFQAWGAGGAGGPVNYLTNSTTPIRAGGGGSGGYVTFSYTVPSCVSTAGMADLGPSCPNLTVTVGAGGIVGVSSASQGAVTASTDGGDSTVAIGSTYYARGGKKGVQASYSTTNLPWGGAGGTGGTASGSGATTQTGNVGQSSSNGGGGADGIQGFGAGGDGSTAVYSQGQLNYTPGGNGNAGRVRVYWVQ